MTCHIHLGCLQLSSDQGCMNRALTHGLGTGTSLALWLNLLGGLDNPGPFLASDFLCPAPGLLELHLPSILIGVVIGLLIGPVLEALLSLRVLLYQAALRRGGGLAEPRLPRPLYRIQ